MLDGAGGGDVAVRFVQVGFRVPGRRAPDGNELQPRSSGRCSTGQTTFANKEHLMQHTRLGSTGLVVSRLALGCMSYGDPTTPDAHPWALTEDQAEPFFRQ